MPDFLVPQVSRVFCQVRLSLSWCLFYIFLAAMEEYYGVLGLLLLHPRSGLNMLVFWCKMVDYCR